MLPEPEGWNLSNKASGMYIPYDSLPMTEDPVNRRKNPRLSLRLPVTLRGVDTRGKAFVLDTALDNISAGGAYIMISKCLDIGTQVRMLIRFSVSPDAVVGARVAAHGDVTRIEEKKGGTYGVAFRFTNYKFL
jgi:c-di-GMP-binding flagellar brake protein YcgR